MTSPPANQKGPASPGLLRPMFRSSFEPFFFRSREGGQCCAWLVHRESKALPPPPACSKISLALTSFFVLLPKLQGQLDVPKHHHSTVLAHNSSAGCRQPLLWWSWMRASQHQKASIFSPLFLVDFTLASAATATPLP